MAASVQKVTEDVLLRMAKYAKVAFGDETDNLVMAGGVALNCVANGILQREAIFDNIWIQPAAGDAGGALGAALYYYWQKSEDKRQADGVNDGQVGSLLGPSYSNAEIETFLHDNNYPYEKMSGDTIFSRIAQLIDEQKVIGLFEGHMEYGPRALGNRSIIADARSQNMQSRLNLKIKFRESFRPFAPSVIEERCADYFDINCNSPYMLICANVKKERCLDFNLSDSLDENADDLLSVVDMARSDIPAVTHVDFSARIQTVSPEGNPFYYGVIKAFEKLTGCGVIINTSFNVRGEPIVCTPADAYRCFMRTNMDVLVMGNCVLYKENQPGQNVMLHDNR